MKKRIAIIGASTGQLPLCLKAREMGLETYCFAWDEGAVCKKYVDSFIPLSIFEMDEIVDYCKSVNIDGVVSNASETTAMVASYVAEKLGKTGVPYRDFINIRNKEFVRQKTNGIEGLAPVNFMVGEYNQIIDFFPRPFVIKPINGAAKKGVNFVDTDSEDLAIPDDLKDATFMAEEYIEGKEYSVESISYNNHHDVIQITEKIGTGAPHFVELEHHQPANLPIEETAKIKKIIPKILTSIGFTNGASHIEIKVNSQGFIYLIEVNPRGGGDYISNELIALSTDYDYLKQMILVSLGSYESVSVKNVACSGIYFLSAYTSRLLPYFDSPKESWMKMRERIGNGLTYSCSNYDRDGFILYCSENKIIL